MNTLSPQDVADLYPQFAMFAKHRQAQDPERVFITPYLKKLLGI